MSSPPSERYEDLRPLAREIFQHALQSASIKSAFERHTYFSRGVLRVCDDLYQLDSFSRLLVISFGKAAHSMATALAEQLGPLATGIICAPEIAGQPQLPGFRYFHGGHPLPNAESVRSADAILKSLSSLDSKSLVIYLISSGAAMVESPIDKEISLEDHIAAYTAFNQSGMTLTEKNVICKHLSATKGGRMAQVAGRQNAQQVSVMVSNVPDHGALDSLACGPTMPDQSSTDDCYRIASQYEWMLKLPLSVRELFERRALEETLDKDDPVFHACRWWPILSNVEVLRAAAAKAVESNFAVEIDNSYDGWDHADAADRLLCRLRELRKGASRVCLISGGGLRVKLAGDHGIGGSNQQFALHCASKIASENITVFSAGTDGIDGNSPAAGAVVDGRTMQRFTHVGAGENICSVLKNFDTYRVFEQSGDTIMTGATGNDVGDLRILMAY